jgi:ketosteroid isomerase-like protein
MFATVWKVSPLRCDLDPAVCSGVVIEVTAPLTARCQSDGAQPGDQERKPVTTLTKTARPLVDKYYALIDDGHLSEASTMYTDDVKLTFANAEPVYGRAAAEAAIQHVLDRTTGIKHDVVTFWDEEGPDGTRVAVFEIRITYYLKSGNVINNPGCVVAIVNEDDQFTEQRLYGDLNNVFAG